ncbi:DotU family type IV/VI secretion system protein [Pseudomonas fluorescens]|nr:DotU family type IV/VI secretion system protein [Pseudomonas fluorescens]NKI56045.1 DotU family type IV/VI secretion system protein [Pseudomonas fluorescens]NKI66685.1 DotU family type IV/VI secretion system protein [Pseudomonas fluorescens]NLT86473.1 DotU family type IV/VI secretion system protein [Pseudomonas lactis]
MDSEYTQDEKTVLLDRETHEPAQGPLTDFPSPPRYEQLEDRMIYAGHRLDTHSFQTGLNPLVAAALAVLFEVIGIRVCSGRENLGTLNDRLVLAVTQFETRALQGGVENSQVMSARYVLCSVIDEAVVTTPWGAQSEWSKMSLLSRFHNETFGGEKVFQLLERLTRDPVKHLAMLELLYLCLSLGFEGKYRVMERGVAQLEAVRDALYRQIRHVRGEPAAQALLPAQQRADRRKQVRVIPATWWVGLTLVCVLAMYTGFAWVLSNERTNALHPLQLSASDLVRTPL